MSKRPSNAEAVMALPKKDRVDVLAQALLREYMHRRGFKATLAAFDAECPRTETTISSRQLMVALLSFSRIQDRLMRQSAPFHTFMERFVDW